MKNTNEACLYDQSYVSNYRQIINSLRCTFPLKFLSRNPIQMIEVWLHRRKQRSHLMDLSDYLLDDIGLTRDQVNKEYNRPFWKEGIF